MTDTTASRSRALWLDTLAEPLALRPPLPGPTEVDVAVIGAGFTGLWTAYYLAEADPSLRVAVLEREYAGFGASGRNGGWCSALFAGSRSELAREHGRDSVVAMQRAMFATVDEVGAICTRENIDAAFHKGGTLTFATNRAQVARLRAALAVDREWGFGPEDVEWLDAGRANTRIALTGVLGAISTPHCARVQPGALARGLARAVERRGVVVYERTPVFSVERGRVRTAAGDVRAEVVVRATEGYTSGFRRWRRALVPLYSLVIATEPLPATVWNVVGWNGRETLSDGRHLLIYAQRTADDRIVFGGRGAPYHYGSRVEARFDRDPRVFGELRHTLTRMFPAVAGAAITHAWGGPLGVPRDWCSSVGYDRAAGFAWAGGYVGDGVGTSNLAGRTLADLVTGTESPLVRLPWVGHRSPTWEPEPWRWLGINLAIGVPRLADRIETRTGRRTRLLDAVLDRFTGA